MPVYKAISYDEREGFAGGGARRSRHSRASRGLRGSDRDRGGPDRRAGGLPAGGLTKRQKEAIADAQRQKNLQRDAMQRQQRLQAEEEARRIEQSRVNEAELARQELQRQNELRLAKEAEAERQKLKRMADLKAQQEADLAAQKAAAQAAMGPQGLGAIVPEGETHSAKTAFEEVMDKNPNIDFMGATPETVKRDIFGNIYTEDDKRLGSMGQLSDVGKLGTVGGIATSALNFMGVPLDTPTFTANEAYQREMAREMGGPDRRAIDTRGGFAKFLGDRPIVKHIMDQETADEGYVGINPRIDTKPTGAIDYSNVGANTMSTPVVTPISAQRTSTNLRDYYARLLGQDPAMYAANGGRIGFANGANENFYVQDTQNPTDEETYNLKGRQMNLTLTGQEAFKSMTEKYPNMSPWKIMDIIENKFPQYITNPNFRDDPFSGLKANGGRVGRMNGGMMIMGDNGVVNNGIGGIMKKYQRIRSEL